MAVRVPPVMRRVRYAPFAAGHACLPDLTLGEHGWYAILGLLGPG